MSEIKITREDVIGEIRQILDPDLYIDIWTLGLIYDFVISETTIDVTMTFTSVACPAGPQLVHQVKTRLGKLEGIETVNVEIVFDPPWEPSEELKGMMGLY